MLPLQWEITTSRAQAMEARPRLSTHSATSATTTAKSASFCTTRRFHFAFPYRRQKCKLCRVPGPMPSNRSRRRILLEAITLPLQPKRQASSTATATRTCSSSPPRRLMRSSVRRPRMPCHTSWGTRRLRTVTPRTPVSPSTAARAGRTWFSKTTRSM